MGNRPFALGCSYRMNCFPRFMAGEMVFSSIVSFWEALMIPCCSSNILTKPCLWIPLKSKHVYEYPLIGAYIWDIKFCGWSTFPFGSLPRVKSGSDQMLGTASQPEACRGGVGRGPGRQIQSWCFHTAAKDAAYYVVCASIDVFVFPYESF